jgi:hypothetical protein
LKHSSAIARYSVAVFMGRCASRRNSLAGFSKLVCLRPDSKGIISWLICLSTCRVSGESDGRCPLYPQRPTSLSAIAMSA